MFSRKVLVLGFALLAVTALSGCENYTSPKAVSGTALESLKKNDFALWSRTLTENAAAQYGNMDSFAEFKKTVSEFDKVFAQDEVLVSRKPGEMGDSERVYSLDAMGSVKVAGSSVASRIAQLSIRCDYTYRWVWEKRTPRTPPVRTKKTTSVCKIADIVR